MSFTTTSIISCWLNFLRNSSPVLGCHNVFLLLGVLDTNYRRLEVQALVRAFFRVFSGYFCWCRVSMAFSLFFLRMYSLTASLQFSMLVSSFLWYFFTLYLVIFSVRGSYICIDPGGFLVPASVMEEQINYIYTPH